MELDILKGSSVEICGKEYDYRGHASEITDEGVFIEDNGTLFVPWREIIYMAKNMKDCEDGAYRAQELKLRKRILFLKGAIYAVAISVGVLVAWVGNAL